MADFKKLNAETGELLYKYFKDKKDNGGNDYIFHLYAVANAVENELIREKIDKHSDEYEFYTKAYYVALLHDILEDTECTEEELIEIGCDAEMIEAIKAITRLKSEQFYFNFIKRVSENPIATLVKIYDLENNMDVRRLTSFGDYEMKRLKKYWYSWKYLKAEISEETYMKNIFQFR